MHDIFDISLGITLLILLSVVFWVAIPYVIWMIYTGFKKQWSRLYIQILVPVTIFGSLFIISAISQNIHDKQFLEQVFDMKVKLGRSEYSYHSPFTLNGDGYDFLVYKLPESIRKKFESPDKLLLMNFPTNQPDWDTVHWRKGPLDSQFSKYIDFALPNFRKKPKKLEKYYADVHSTLSHEHTYYSFYKIDRNHGVGNVVLFIVDLEKGKLYSIYSNT